MAPLGEAVHMFKSGNGESWWSKTPRCHHIYPCHSPFTWIKIRFVEECSFLKQDILPLQKLGASGGLCSLYLR
ncbi:hypothetical protein L3X38_007196 [Prunus dulcis]|uniref:Uncharacterized protein n=1 Tax=Prunus dulcis TaxID=3755 RepID=A0AAD5F5P4_PRUDU|nr:hypothetical protein L3X38_007196 [Prunus dulcis]